MKKQTMLPGYICLPALFFLNTLRSTSQENFQVTGKVNDDSGKPMAGVTASVKESGAATSTMTTLDRQNGIRIFYHLMYWYEN